ncbi:MAG: FkbM family methyltransferase [Angustibacter sp.]
MNTAPGTVVIRELNNVSIAYRLGTTDEFVLDEEYAAARFLPEGFQPPEDATILDVGAHIGVFAALVSPLVPHGAVHALEPSGENFVLLERNLRDNQASHAVAHKIALSDKSGTMRLHHAPGSVGHSFYQNPDWAGEEWEARPEDAPPQVAYEDVPVLVLEDFLTEHGIDRVDFMKMNIEGAEYDVLLTADESTLRRIQSMCVEVHPDPDGRTEKLMNRLREVGFSISFADAGDNPYVTGWITAHQST